MIIEEHKYGEDDDGYNNELFEHIAQQNERTRYSHQQVPGDMHRR